MATVGTFAYLQRKAPRSHIVLKIIIDYIDAF